MVSALDRLMRHCAIVALIAAGLLGLAPTAGLSFDDTATATKTAHVRVIVDTSDAPETVSWARMASRLIVKWYPRICDVLKTDVPPSSEVRLVFWRAMRAPASTSGDTISVSADHIRRHPDDYGMVVHELTHVIQRYPKFNKENGWLVEGMADYIRYFHFEPDTNLPRIDPARASYRDGYKTAAQFLDWIKQNHDANIVPKLNLVLRRGAYRPQVFKQWTGKSLDELWEEFRQSLPRR